MFKKEYTIEDFKPMDGCKPLKADGRWSPTEGEWSLNYSSILTELIQQAGRWCEHYASDLFIDWMTIDRCLKNRDVENRSFLFGFRQIGVDHDQFIFSRFNQNPYERDTYRTIYRLDIVFIESTNPCEDDKIEMVLYRVQ